MWKAGIFLFLIFYMLATCLASAVGLRLLYLESKASGPDSVVRSETRLKSLREALPPQGLAGYVTKSAPRSYRRYYIAQYVLSPVILVPIKAKTKPDLCVADFDDPESLKQFLDTDVYEVLLARGDGVALLKRAPGR